MWQWLGRLLLSFALLSWIVGCAVNPTLSSETGSLSKIFVNNNTSQIDNRDLALAVAFVQLGTGVTVTDLVDRANQLQGSNTLIRSQVAPIPSIATLDFANPQGEITVLDLSLMLAAIQQGSNAPNDVLAERTERLQGIPNTIFTASDILFVPGREPTPTPSPASTPFAVDIESFNFIPDSVTIKVGQSVSWKNLDFVGHTSTSDTRLWDSPLLFVNTDPFVFTFTEPGTFSYHCDPHPSMKGTVIVEP